MNHPPLDLVDDWLTVTGEHDPLDFAQWLESLDPGTFAWQAGKPSKFYSASLIAPGGVVLNYAPKRGRQDGLEAPQSDARDSHGFSLEVPADPARGLLGVLRTHPRQRDMQCSRRDIAVTFRPKLPAQVYACFRELVESGFNRPAWHIGPTSADWQAVTLQTHRKPSKADRFVILYDKHAESPDEYPDPGTLRLEFRFQPDKKAGKRLLFTQDAFTIVGAWRFARRVLGTILEADMEPSPVTWRPPTPAGDLDRMTAYLLRSYGPTILRGIELHGVGYLHCLGIASALQAAPRRDLATEPRPAVPAAPASDPSEAVTDSPPWD